MLKYLLERYNIVLGIVFIITSYPIGWISLIYFIKKARISKKNKFYVLGAVLYGFSWLLLLFGLFLCGERYSAIVYYKYHRIFTIISASIITLFLIYEFILKKRLKFNQKRKLTNLIKEDKDNG
ncbi:MAG: hypothetical protein LBT79_02055 [Elusimicrobiota bacterium]|jgi:hypothetical protein|nr:hypothetical protein [Elusimicrobiota bacterium]